MKTLSIRLSRFGVDRGSRIQLPFPIVPRHRAAQVSPGPNFHAVQRFDGDSWPQLEKSRPRVLIGYRTDLELFRQAVERGEVDASSVDHAVFVLTDCGSAYLSDAERVSIWQGFGVPVYELLIDSARKLIASECEAQEGWHLEPDIASKAEEAPGTDGRSVIRPGFTGIIESQPCACGRDSARLLNVTTVPHSESLQQLAATA